MDAVQLSREPGFRLGAQRHLVAPGADADGRHPQFLVKLFVVAAPGLVRPTQPGLQFPGRREGGKTRRNRRGIGQAQAELEGVDKGGGVAVQGQ